MKKHALSSSPLAYVWKMTASKKVPKFVSVDEAILQHDVQRLRNRTRNNKQHKKSLSMFISHVAQDVQYHMFSFLSNHDLTYLSLSCQHFCDMTKGMKKNMILSRVKLSSFSAGEFDQILQDHELASIVIPDLILDQHHLQMVNNALVKNCRSLQKLDLFSNNDIVTNTAFSNLTHLVLRNVDNADLMERIKPSSGTLRRMELRGPKLNTLDHVFKSFTWDVLQILYIQFSSYDRVEHDITTPLGATPNLSQLSLIFKSSHVGVYLFDVLNQILQHPNCHKLTDLTLKLNGELKLKGDNLIRGHLPLKKFHFLSKHNKKADCLVSFLNSIRTTLRDVALNIEFSEAQRTIELSFPGLERLVIKSNSHTVRKMLKAAGNQLRFMKIKCTEDNNSLFEGLSPNKFKLLTSLVIPADLASEEIDYIARNLKHLQQLKINKSSTGEPSDMKPLVSVAKRLKKLEIAPDIPVEDVEKLVFAAQEVDQLKICTEQFLLSKPISVSDLCIRLLNRFDSKMVKTFADYLPCIKTLNISCYAIGFKRLNTILSKMVSLTDLKVDTVWNSTIWNVDGENGTIILFPYKPNVTRCEISLEEGYFSAQHLILLAAAFFNATHFKLTNDYNDDSKEREEVSLDTVRQTVKSLARKTIDECLLDSSKKVKSTIADTIEEQLSSESPSHFIVRKLLLDALEFRYIFEKDV